MAKPKPITTDTTIKRFLTNALWFARAGYLVAPLRPNEKKPMLPMPDLIATDDPDDIKVLWGYGTEEQEQDIRDLFAGHFLAKSDASTNLDFKEICIGRAKYYYNLKFCRSANIGVASGKSDDPEQPLGVTNIDLDNESHGETDGLTGFDSWAKLMCSDPRDASSMVIKTPSGGLHLWFRYSPDVPHGAGRLADAGYPHIDFINNCNNLIVAPCSTVDFGEYSFVARAKYDDLPEVPERIIEVVKDQHDKRNKRRSKPKAVTEYGVQSRHSMQKYVDTWQPATQGERNPTAYKNARYLISRFPTFNSDDHMSVLETWNDRNNPPLDFSELQNCYFHAYQDFENGKLELKPYISIHDKCSTLNLPDRCQASGEYDNDTITQWLKDNVSLKQPNWRIAALYLNHRFPNLDRSELSNVFWRWQWSQVPIDGKIMRAVEIEDDESIERYLRSNRDTESWLPERNAIRESIRDMLKLKMGTADIAKQIVKRYPSSSKYTISNVWRSLQ